MNRRSPADFFHFTFLCLFAVGLAFSAPAAARFIPQPTLSSSYFLDDAGALWAWGDNSHGQLGDGTLTSRARPRRIEAPGVTRWTDVSASPRVLAVDQAGHLWAWGSTEVLQSWAPVQLTALTNRWKRVAALEREPIGVSVDVAGGAWMWRIPLNGEPGPLTDARPEPIAHPPGVTRWVEVAAGHAHAALLADSGQIFVLGANRLGQSFAPWVNLPEPDLVEVPSPNPRLRWLEIAAGPEQCFGRSSDGEWYFWGAHLNGPGWQVVTNPQVLRRPATVTAWRKVVAGERHVLLLSSAGLTFGLGVNWDGQLASPPGGELLTGYTNEPVRVFPVHPVGQHVADIGAGWRHGLSLGEDGLLYTWGDNAGGQLGRVAEIDDWRPQNVRGDLPPFSPSGPELPRLRLVALDTNLVAPVLAGQLGTSAHYEIRRVAGSSGSIPLQASLLTNAQLPTLPLSRVAMVFSTHPSVEGDVWHLEARGIVPNFANASDRDTLYSGNTEIRVEVPPWVEWEASAAAPIYVTFSPLWSLPPQGWVTAERPSYEVNRTNRLTVRVLDSDHWVTGWDLYVRCSETNCPTQRLAGLEGLKLLAGATNTFTVPFVPSQVGPQTLFLVVRDSAGSVVTNVTSIAVSETPQLRFVAAWYDTPPVVAFPARVSAKVQDLTGGSPVVKRELRLYNLVHKVPLVVSDPAEVGDILSVTLAEREDFTGELVVTTADGEVTTLGLLLRQIADARVPGVYFEPVVTEISEGSNEPALVRVVRAGGDLNRSLVVQLSRSPAPTNDVPPPYLNGQASATLGTDYTRQPTNGLVVFPPGVTTQMVTLQAIDDEVPEGTEGVLVGANIAASYRMVGDPVIVLLKDNDLGNAWPLIRVTLRSSRQPANETWRPSITVTGSSVGVARTELYLNEHLVGTTTAQLRPPLPVGSWMFQVKAVDLLGREVWSPSFPIEFYPEINLIEQADSGDGTDRWQVTASPDFQPLTLETANDLNAWQPVQPWFITPTNRVIEVHLPAGDQRYLRVVPAP